MILILVYVLKAGDMIIPVSPKAYIGRVAEVLEYPTLVIHHLLDI